MSVVAGAGRRWSQFGCHLGPGWLNFASTSGDGLLSGRLPVVVVVVPDGGVDVAGRGGRPSQPLGLRPGESEWMLRHLRVEWLRRRRPMREPLGLLPGRQSALQRLVPSSSVSCAYFETCLEATRERETNDNSVDVQSARVVREVLLG